MPEQPSTPVVNSTSPAPTRLPEEQNVIGQDAEGISTMWWIGGTAWACGILGAGALIGSYVALPEDLWIISAFVPQTFGALIGFRTEVAGRDKLKLETIVAKPHPFLKTVTNAGARIVPTVGVTQFAARGL